MTNKTVERAQAHQQIARLHPLHPFNLLFPAPGSRLLDDSWPFAVSTQNTGSRWGLMEEPVSHDDGATSVKYNLAGWDKKDIAVHLDSVNSQVTILAEREAETGRRRFRASFGVPPYATAEDVTTAYRDGVLTVTVAPLEERKQDALTAIPIADD